MNKSIVRNSIESVKGKKLHFRYDGSRNQIEEFDGVIDDIYNSIFIIKHILVNILSAKKSIMFCFA